MLGKGIFPTALWFQVGELERHAFGQRLASRFPMLCSLALGLHPVVTEEMEQHPDSGNFFIGGFKKAGLVEKRYLAQAAFSSKIVKALLLAQLEDDRFLLAAAGLRSDTDKWVSDVARTPDFVWVRIADQLQLGTRGMKRSSRRPSLAHTFTERRSTGYWWIRGDTRKGI